MFSETCVALFSESAILLSFRTPFNQVGSHVESANLDHQLLEPSNIIVALRIAYPRSAGTGKRWGAKLNPEAGSPPASISAPFRGSVLGVPFSESRSSCLTGASDGRDGTSNILGEGHAYSRADTSLDPLVVLRGRSLRRGRCRQHSQSECVSNTRGCHSRDWCAVLGSGRRGLLCLRCHSNRGIVSAVGKQRATESVGYTRMASRFRFPLARQPKEPSAEEILREKAPYWSQRKAPHRLALRRLEKSTGRARLRREPEKSSGLRRSFAISCFFLSRFPKRLGLN